MTEYVTTAGALFFHKQLIERYGGATGIRDPGALESALHRPQTGYYDSLIHEAAALLDSIVQNHPFVDGDKRVAFAVVDVFLRINGYSITADSNVIYAFMMKLFEAHTFDMEYLAPWLEEGTDGATSSTGKRRATASPGDARKAVGMLNDEY